jgi:two-component system, chemotaxis family, protein-glutamate methylesterase/glutaminase
LADNLDKKSKIRVKEAEENEPVKPNFIYVAPGGRHMILKRSTNESSVCADELKICLNDNPPEENCRPSVNVLFRSIAETFSGNVLAVIMTGMGSDGLEGVKALKKKGCYCLTQDKASCVVYGMPKAVSEAGISDESVSLNELANRIYKIVKNTKSEI